MNTRTAHRMAKKAMIKAKMNKEERKWAHKCVHAYRHGGGFDNFRLMETDKAMLQHGFDAWSVCPDNLRRSWTEQPD